MYPYVMSCGWFEKKLRKISNLIISNLKWKYTFNSLALVKHDNKFLSEKGLRIHGMSATCSIIVNQLVTEFEISWLYHQQKIFDWDKMIKYIERKMRRKISLIRSSFSFISYVCSANFQLDFSSVYNYSTRIYSLFFSWFFFFRRSMFELLE